MKGMGRQVTHSSRRGSGGVWIRDGSGGIEGYWRIGGWCTPPPDAPAKSNGLQELNRTAGPCPDGSLGLRGTEAWGEDQQTIEGCGPHRSPWSYQRQVATRAGVS